MFLLIEHGEIWDPRPLGAHALLAANGKVEAIGRVDRAALERVATDLEVIDATDCVVAPGFVDCHQHLLGGSGEGSFALQTPMLFPREIVRAGITTVVGVLGVDTTMKTLQGLLARVKAMKEEGLSAYMWSGGYNVPPTTLLGSVREDMMYVEEVIGAGEIAVSDERGLNQSTQELAKLVRDVHVGGLLTGKCGRTHLHVGEEPTRLAPLRELIDDYHVKPEWLYPTHVQRDEKLIAEAMELCVAGAYVDFDTVNADLARWLRWWLDHDAPMDRLTVSSDADSGTPDLLYRQLCEAVVKHRIPLELVLPLATSNAAEALKLQAKGRLFPGGDADLVIMDRTTLELRHVVAGGEVLVRDGVPTRTEKFLAKSKRHITLHGADAPPGLERLDPPLNPPEDG